MLRAYYTQGIWYLQSGTLSGGNTWTWKNIRQCPDSPEAYATLRGWGALCFVTRADEPIPQALRRHRPPTSP